MRDPVFVSMKYLFSILFYIVFVFVIKKSARCFTSTHVKPWATVKSKWNWLQKWLRFFCLFTIKSTFLSDIFHPIELSILEWISFFSAVTNKSAGVAGVERFLESLSADNIKRSSVNRDESVSNRSVRFLVFNSNNFFSCIKRIQLNWIGMDWRVTFTKIFLYLPIKLVLLFFVFFGSFIGFSCSFGWNAWILILMSSIKPTYG